VNDIILRVTTQQPESLCEWEISLVYTQLQLGIHRTPASESLFDFPDTFAGKFTLEIKPFHQQEYGGDTHD
jgi:hypothetical protein